MAKVYCRGCAHWMRIKNSTNFTDINYCIKNLPVIDTPIEKTLDFSKGNYEYCEDKNKLNNCKEFKSGL